MQAPHLPLAFLEHLHDLQTCQRCRVRAMTYHMLLELIEEAYGLQSVPAGRLEAS
jgi:hypothetical protein